MDQDPSKCLGAADAARSTEKVGQVQVGQAQVVQAQAVQAQAVQAVQVVQVNFK